VPGCCKSEYLLHLSIYHYIKAPKMATTCSYLFHHKRFRDTFPTDGTANTTGSLSWPYTRPSSQRARVIGPGSTSIVPTTPQTGHRCTQVAHDVFQSLPLQVPTLADTWCIFKRWRIYGWRCWDDAKFFRELRQWNMNNGERGNVRGLPQYQSINTQYTYIVYWLTHEKKLQNLRLIVLRKT